MINLAVAAAQASVHRRSENKLGLPGRFEQRPIQHSEAAYDVSRSRTHPLTA